MQRIFVYGSLRQGHYNYKKYLQGRSRFCGHGWVRGELYALCGVTYPALIAGEQRVLGEIYEVSDAVAKAIDVLEEYEEGNPDNEYERIAVMVYDAQGQEIAKLPVYFYNMQKQHAYPLDELIPHGDYSAYMQTKQK